MKAILTILLCMALTGAMAQVTTIDVAKVRGQYEKEALYFYENNWKAFREEALKQKFISGFDLVKSDVDSVGVVTLWLITHYGDSASYAAMEDNFRGIMKRLSPGGPKMLNSVLREEFMVSVEGFSGERVAGRP